MLSIGLDILIRSLMLMGQKNPVLRISDRTVLQTQLANALAFGRTKDQVIKTGFVDEIEGSFAFYGDEIYRHKPIFRHVFEGHT